MQVRRVDCTGHISWKHVSVFLSDVLAGERVGLLPIDERHYEVYFVSTPLARFDSHRLRMQRLPSTKCERRKIHGGKKSKPKSTDESVKDVPGLECKGSARLDTVPISKTPDGITHHYAPLGLIQVDASGKVQPEVDCRKPFTLLTNR